MNPIRRRRYEKETLLLFLLLHLLLFSSCLLLVLLLLLLSFSFPSASATPFPSPSPRRRGRGRGRRDGTSRERDSCPRYGASWPLEAPSPPSNPFAYRAPPWDQTELYTTHKHPPKEKGKGDLGNVGERTSFGFVGVLLTVLLFLIRDQPRHNHIGRREIH